VEIKDAIAKMDVGATINLTCMVSESIAGKGMNLFVRFTQGFVDLTINDGTDRHTSSLLQFGASFPFIETPGEEN